MDAPSLRGRNWVCWLKKKRIEPLSWRGLITLVFVGMYTTSGVMGFYIKL